MIRLTRGNPPSELDASTATDLTAEYARTSDSVWNKRYIRDGLLARSSAKCAYCETKLNEESKYMEVEHFRCKKDFPHLVVQWDNLLPACKRCNGRKHDYNVDAEGMIVDPFSTDPVQHFYFHNFRLRWRDDIGRRTIDTLYLNDSDRLVGVRLKIGEAIAESLEAIRDQLETYAAGPQTTAKRNTVTRGIEKLLREAMPEAEFSALASTVLFSDENYKWIKENLITLNLWESLEPLESSIRASALLP